MCTVHIYIRGRYAGKLEEENMEKELTIEDLRAGDVIEISRVVEITSVDKFQGTVSEKGTGGKVRLKKSHYAHPDSRERPFKFTKVKKAETKPVHWPPQLDDVWELEGKRHHAIQNFGTIQFVDKTGYRHATDPFKKTGIKLVYRAGRPI
jgi:hypothetical protein